LADLLWGDELPATWEKALRVLMTKLRALLEECGIDGSTALTSAFGCYKLTLPAGVWIDASPPRGRVQRCAASAAAGAQDGMLRSARVREAVPAIALLSEPGRAGDHPRPTRGRLPDRGVAY
jgi:hypothetical protein